MIVDVVAKQLFRLVPCIPSNRCALLFGMTVLSAGYSRAAGDEQEKSASITVTVTVESQDDGPIEDIPIVLQASTGTVAGGVTGANGRVVLEGEVPTADKIAIVRLVAGTDEIFPQEEQAGIWAGTIEFRLNWCSPQGTLIDLQTGRVHEVNVEASPCVTVRGRVQNETGDELEYVVMPLTFDPSIAMWNGTGEFETSIPRASESDLFVMDQHGWVEIVSIKTEQAVDGGDLGVTDLPTLGEQGSLVLNGSNAAMYEAARDSGTGDLVLLLSMDGERLFVPLKSAMVETQNGRVLIVPRQAVPAGEYYVVPGSPAFSPLSLNLVRAVRAGLDLSSFSVPRIEITPDEETIHQFDVFEAHRELFRVPIVPD